MWCGHALAWPYDGCNPGLFNAANAGSVPPMTSQQKFHLALKGTIDPTAFLGAAIKAGTYQVFDWQPGFGQGVSSYAERFSSSFGDGATDKMLGTYVFPSLFHQDPRYFQPEDSCFTLWECGSHANASKELRSRIKSYASTPLTVKEPIRSPVRLQPFDQQLNFPCGSILPTANARHP